MQVKVKAWKDWLKSKFNELRSTEKGRQRLSFGIFLVVMAVFLAVCAGVRAWMSQFPEDTWIKSREYVVSTYQQQEEFISNMEEYSSSTIAHATDAEFELGGYKFSTNLDKYEDSWYDAVCTGPNKYTILFMQSDPEMYQKTLYTVYLNTSPIGMDTSLCVELVDNSSAVLGMAGYADDFEISVVRG